MGAFSYSFVVPFKDAHAENVKQRNHGVPDSVVKHVARMLDSHKDAYTLIEDPDKPGEQIQQPNPIGDDELIAVVVEGYAPDKEDHPLSARCNVTLRRGG